MERKVGKLGMLVLTTSLVVLVLGFGALGCDKHELDALMELKSAINHPNGAALDGWTKQDETGSPSNCCDWEEVVCGESGQVVDLFLHGLRQEEWYVNASVFLPFSHLQNLGLSSNFITGWTPHLRQLTSLQELNLSYNLLQGMLDACDIEALKNLQSLDLSYTDIDGFKRSHGNLSSTSKLEELYLVDNRVNDANTFVESLSLFPSLKTIDLSLIDLRSIQTYGWLCQLKNIQEIYLAGIGGLQGIYTFWNMLSSISIQNELDISTKKHIYTYAGGILDEMSAFDLSCNNLSGDIPPELGNMTGVRAFNLSHNKLDGPIPSTLSNLSSIESLDLSYNYLSGSIPFELTRLHTLEVFSVAYNSLSGEIPETDQFGTFTDSYQGNPLLCGAPLLQDCSPHTPNSPEDQDEEDDDSALDMEAFYASFSVTSVIIFVATLIVLYVNPYWRRAWFYFSEMWITCAYYFIVDGARKAMRASVGVILRIIHCH